MGTIGNKKHDIHYKHCFLQLFMEINDPVTGDSSFVEVTSGKVSTIKVEETIYDLLVRPGNKLIFYSLDEDEIHNEYEISIIQTSHLIGELILQQTHAYFKAEHWHEDLLNENLKAILQGMTCT